jgi:hypothetical protein
LWQVPQNSGELVERLQERLLVELRLGLDELPVDPPSAGFSLKANG